jgi:hypothetical protein
LETTASAAIRSPLANRTPVTRPPRDSMRSTGAPQRTSSARAIASTTEKTPPRGYQTPSRNCR